MKVLLDTHIILWVLENNVKLPEKAREIIEDEVIRFIIVRHLCGK